MFLILSSRESFIANYPIYLFYLYLRKGEHLFPISMHCWATNDFSSLFLSPKYLLTELEFKKNAKKRYLLLLITAITPQLNPSWPAADLVHSQHISDHIIQEAFLCWESVC